jgi:hypothetical protein
MENKDELLKKEIRAIFDEYFIWIGNQDYRLHPHYAKHISDVENKILDVFMKQGNTWTL